MSRVRILVPVKRALDYAIKPRISKSRPAVDTTGQKHSMNPFDELAIEEAVRLREKGPPGLVSEIMAVAAGPQRCTDVLRSALGMGADRGIHVFEDAADNEHGVFNQAVGESDIEPLFLASILKKIVLDRNINLVLLGKQSIDSDAGQTGPMLAGLLGWSQAMQASRVQLTTKPEPSNDGHDMLSVTREIDGGTETLQARLPMVVSADLRLNQPRLVSLRNVMQAKRKPIDQIPLSNFDLNYRPRLKVLDVSKPSPRVAGEMASNVDDFISKLQSRGAF